MNRIVVVVLGLMMFVVGYFAICLQLPRVHNDALLKEAYQAGLAQYQELGEKVNDPKSNGYLSPAFARFWAGEEENAVILAWRSQVAVGDHALMLDVADKAYLKARTAFATVLPDLHREFRKPVFADPRPRFLTAFEPPNYRVNLLHSAEAMSGYAQSKLAEGPSSEGVEALVSLCHLGAKLRARGQLVDRIQGLQVSEWAFEVFLATLERHRGLSAEDWEQIGEALRLGPPKSGFIRASLEDEVTAGATTFIRINENRFYGHPAFTEAGVVLRIPGMMVREERIYYNYLTSLLELSETPLSDFPSSKGSWIAGTSGVLNDALVQFPTDYPRRVERLRLQYAMAGLLTGVAIHFSEQGQWPEKLVGAPDVSPEDIQYAFVEDRAELVWKVSPPLRELPGWPKRLDRRDDAFVFRL